MKIKKSFFGGFLVTCLLISACSLAASSSGDKITDNSEAQGNSNGNNIKTTEVSKGQWSKVVNNLEFFNKDNNFTYKFWYEDEESYFLFFDKGKIEFREYEVDVLDYRYIYEVIENSKRQDGTYQFREYQLYDEEDENSWEYNIYDSAEDPYMEFTKPIDPDLGLLITDFDFDKFTYDNETKSYKAESATWTWDYEWARENGRDLFNLSNIELKFENNNLTSIGYNCDDYRFEGRLYDYGTTKVNIPANAKQAEKHSAYKDDLSGKTFVFVEFEDAAAQANTSMVQAWQNAIVEFNQGRIGITLVNQGTIAGTYSVTGSTTFAYNITTQITPDGQVAELPESLIPIYHNLNGTINENILRIESRSGETVNGELVVTGSTYAKFTLASN